jgi:hypothetical protein
MTNIDRVHRESVYFNNMKPIDFIKSKQEGVILNDYSLKDMEWFMTEYHKHLALTSNNNMQGYIKLTKKDSIVLVFADGINTCTATISTEKLKELIIDHGYEVITEPICNSSSCAVNNFCECKPL